jgi:hypothetical protein
MRCVAHHKNLSWGGVGVSVFPLGQPFCKRLYLESQVCQDVASSQDFNTLCPNLSYNPPGVSGAQFLSAANILVNGSAPILDTSGSITSPIGGATLTWHFASGLDYTATAAAYESQGAASSSSGSGPSSVSNAPSAAATASATRGGATTSAGSSAPAATTKASSAAKNLGIGRTGLVVWTVVLALCFSLL